MEEEYGLIRAIEEPGGCHATRMPTVAEQHEVA